MRTPFSELNDFYTKLSDPRLALLRGKEDGKTLLHIASNHGNIEIASILIDLGFDVHVSDNLERTPFFYSNDIKTLKFFLNNESKINHQDYYGFTLLHMHAYEGNKDFVSQLIDLGANINILDRSGDSPLHRACTRGNVECIKLLIEKGAKIDIKNLNGETPKESKVYDSEAIDLLFSGISSVIPDK